MGIAIFSQRLFGANSHASMKTQFQLLLPGFPVGKVQATGLRKPSTEKPAGACNLPVKAAQRAHLVPVVSRLKIVRRFEQGSHPSCAGRMMISGRMADVCAELERLANHEPC